MNKRFKPFRLVNSRELMDLELSFSKKLQGWNERYALLPFSCVVTNVCKPDKTDDDLLLCSNEYQTIALLQTKHLWALKQCLFGDSSACFDSVSQPLLAELIKQLLDMEHINLEQQKNTTFLQEEWFYHGSATIAIKLSIGKDELTLYLHPEWVQNELPKLNSDPLPKVDLKDLLGSELLRCQVELKPFTLKVKDTLNLKVGDVIKSDHLLSSPLDLKQQGKSICLVEPGQAKQHKSIQIVSSL